MSLIYGDVAKSKCYLLCKSGIIVSSDRTQTDSKDGVAR